MEMITVKGEKNMKSIRRGVFETNSSSTHSITMCAAEDYEAWKQGKMYFDSRNDKFLTMDDILEKFSDLNLPPNRNNVDDVLKDHDIFSYKGYFENESELEDFSGTFTTKGGEKVMAFGKYGYNG